MDNNYMHLVLVVDRSGSMAGNGLAQESTTSINNLIKEQASVPGKLTVSLYQFDSHYEKVFGPIDAKDAPEYTLVPRGSTALNDSLYRAITETGEFLSSIPETLRPGKVIVNVVTDGLENASKEVSLTQLQESIKHQTDTYKWEFVFMASGLKAYDTASMYGFGTSVQMTNTQDRYASAYGNLSKSITATRTMGGTIAANFSAVDSEATVVDSSDTSSSVGNSE